jgi:hypothetical protein
MQYMNCNACQRVVQINNTGICLGCQRGFTGVDAEDVYKSSETCAKNEHNMHNTSTDNAHKMHVDRLQARQKEIEEALEKTDPSKPEKPKRAKK